MVSEESIEFLGEGLFGYKSDRFVDRLSAFEEEDGGDVADAETDRDGRALVHIGLTHSGAAFILVGNLLHNGSQSLAGTTPCSPKIYHSDRIVLQYLVEVFFCDCDFHDININFVDMLIC
jgi:hypothetical protein